jgi:5-methylcytosine-specific restriction endonuclease McrA
MKQLATLPKSADIYFREIYMAKRGPRRAILRNMEGDVLILFDKYAIRTPDVEFIRPSTRLTVPRAAALRHAYTSGPDPLDRLKEDLRTAAGHRLCCYCMMDSGSTTDHYLPKQVFPEYSVYSQNLIPACSSCNQRRGKLVRRGRNRIFAHLHSENLPNARWLYARAVTENSTDRLVYYLRRPTSISRAQFSLLERHYEELDLLNRFEERTDEILAAARRDVRKIKGVLGKPPDSATIADTMREEALGCRATYCANYYQVAAYFALARKPGFIT